MRTGFDAERPDSRRMHCLDGFPVALMVLAVHPEEWRDMVLRCSGKHLLDFHYVGPFSRLSILILRGRKRQRQ